MKNPEHLKYLEYCNTEREKEVVQLIAEYGNPSAAAKSEGVDGSNHRGLWRTIRSRAALKGYAPGHFEHGVAEGFNMGKVTVQRNALGLVERVWERQHPEGRAAELMIERIEAHTYRPAPVIKTPSKTLKKLLSLYTLTDFHLGMYAWEDETGDNWNEKIAEETLLNAINDMCNRAPDSETAILNIQGDFLHWDGLLALTPSSRHVLDADTRYGKLVDLALDVLDWAITRLLQKHKKVKVIIAEGNHDEAGSIWLRKHIKKMWKKNTRVQVDDTEFPFYAHQHGSIMLAFHHGHKMKNKDLPALFSSEPRYRTMWGSSSICYIHTGHYHHAEQDISEMGGAIVERHPTLAARDSYAARHGYVSWRAARVITYDEKDGEVERATVVPRRKT